MAKEKRVAKSESLTIRMDPKTRFVLEFLSRHRGQTITTVVERAISAAAESVYVETEDGMVSWTSVWDMSDGVRALKMARIPQLFPTYEEERRLAFALMHWPFFYTNPGADTCRRPFVDILWPRIDEFVEFHEANKASDWFGAGKLMAEAILSANVQPPEWPQPAKTNSRPTGARESFSTDLDDEIPF